MDVAADALLRQHPQDPDYPIRSAACMRARTGRELPIFVEVVPAGGDGAHEVDDWDAVARVLDVAGLTMVERMLYCLRHGMELELLALSRVSGLSVKTVGRRLRSARAKIEQARGREATVWGEML